MRVGLLLAALAVVMLAFAGTADAKKKKKKLGPVVTATATASGGTSLQTLTATATCPSGTKVVGGGFSTPPLPPSPSNAGVATSSHKVSATQWFASVQVIGSSGPPIVLTTTAYCRKGAPGTKSVTTATPLGVVGGSPPFPLTSSNASCPAKQILLSGGFTVDPISSMGLSIKDLPISSSRTGSLTWQATGLATEGGHNLTSQADCAKQPKAKKGKKKGKKKIHTPTEVTGDAAGSVSTPIPTAIATCPTKTVPVDGGFSQPGALQSSGTGFFLITASQAVGNTWQVTGLDFGGAPATLRSHGYCSR